MKKELNALTATKSPPYLNNHVVNSAILGGKSDKMLLYSIIRLNKQ